jgi:hypothetical protein
MLALFIPPRIRLHMNLLKFLQVLHKKEKSNTNSIMVLKCKNTYHIIYKFLIHIIDFLSCNPFPPYF